MNALSGILDFGFRMLPGSFLGSIFFFVFRTGRIHRLRSKGLNSSHLRETALFLFFLFCGGLAVLTLTPRWFHWLSLLMSPQSHTDPFFSIGNISLIPLSTFHTDPWSLMILAGNILMFIPLGFFPALLFSGFTLSKTLHVSLFTSLFIEFCQLFIGRSFDIDDLILNVTGFFCGKLLALALPTAFVSRFRPQPMK